MSTGVGSGEDDRAVLARRAHAASRALAAVLEALPATSSRPEGYQAADLDDVRVSLQQWALALARELDDPELLAELL